MPICQIKTNYMFDDEKRKEFCAALAAEDADILGKPLPAIMVMLSDEYMYMNESEDTVVFAEFRYIKKFPDEDAKKVFLSEYADRMLEIFIRYTGVDPYRVYMQFTEMTPEGAWKYNR